MYELVPSKTMREYLASVDFKFNDFQRAALIWNKPDMLWKETWKECRFPMKASELAAAVEPPATSIIQG